MECAEIASLLGDDLSAQAWRDIAAAAMLMIQT
jgi:hypothetical protein